MTQRTVRYASTRRRGWALSGCVLALLILTVRASAQTGAVISSSLDETARITSAGSHLPTPSGGPVALPDGFTAMRLEPGAVLQMSIFDAPEMTQRLLVDDSGDVVVPLAGAVHVEGGSLRDAEQKIAAKLVEKRMMNAPEVMLELSAFAPRSVLVAGEVQQPGKVQVLAPRPLLELIAMVGGVTTAAGGDIEIHHHVANAPDEVRHVAYANGREPTDAEAALIYPGDSIFVRRAGVIYVLGAVVRPGGYLMVNGGTLTLSQAIASASGTTPLASTSRVILVRKSGSGLVQMELRLDKVERGLLAPMPLEDGDMIYVPISKIKSALVNSSVILSSAASAGIYAGFNH